MAGLGSCAIPAYFRITLQRNPMQRPEKIASPRGKLGVLMPGMGAVSTTFMAGVDLVRTGLAKPVGSLTQLGTVRLGKRTEHRSPLIHEFVALENLKNIVSEGGMRMPTIPTKLPLRLVFSMRSISKRSSRFSRKSSRCPPPLTENTSRNSTANI